MAKIIYKGLFLDDESARILVEAQRIKLDSVIQNMHCTFQYRPEFEFPEEIVGKEYSVKVIGYGADDNNSGFQVELPQEIKQYYVNRKTVKNGSEIPRVEEIIPHITVSIAQGAKPIDTGNLDFKKIEESFYIKGRMGYFLEGEKVSYQQPEKEMLDNEVVNIDR